MAARLALLGALDVPEDHPAFLALAHTVATWTPESIAELLYIVAPGQTEFVREQSRATGPVTTVRAAEEAVAVAEFDPYAAGGWDDLLGSGVER